MNYSTEWYENEMVLVDDFGLDIPNLVFLTHTRYVQQSRTLVWLRSLLKPFHFHTTPYKKT